MEPCLLIQNLTLEVLEKCTTTKIKNTATLFQQPIIRTWLEHDFAQEVQNKADHKDLNYV